jgi:hypothetical protein
MCILAGRDPRALGLAASYRERLRRGFTAALVRAHARGEAVPGAPEALGSVLVAAVVGIQATARADDVAEARRQLQGLRALVQGWR